MARKTGRPPKPTALKVVKGERKDRIPKGEPVPSELEVVPPEWLSGEALGVWRRYAPDLEEKKVLTAWDVETFASLCDAVARRREASKRLDEEGAVVDLPVFNKNGDLTGHRRARNPWFYVWKDADSQVQRYGGRFGWTPSDRAHLTIPEAPGGEAERLLS